MNRALSILILLACTAAASADPVLTWTRAAAGGYWVYTVSVQGDNGPAAWNLDVTFTGAFHQNLAGGATHVNTASDANAFDADPDANYAKATDSWFYDNVWTTIAPDATDLTGAASIVTSSLGSLPGLTFIAADVLRLVVPQDTEIAWSGVLSYNGADYPVDGTLLTPPMATLTISENLPAYGDVDLDPQSEDPNAAVFPQGATVTLTAVPVEGRTFRQWTLFDPNFPDDDNYATFDANASITVLMNADRQVKAVWNCGAGAGPLLPMTLTVLGLTAWVRRKRGPR
ncbi:MAG: hypothetical protein JXQ73_32120 [Phycisphaerae bacterium]|nr:hypothetical protein [Phycisphaerae bacterium]